MKRISLLFAAFLVPSLICYSQSQGPFNPIAATYSAAGCLACPGSDWNNFQNVTFPDHLYAYAALANYPVCFHTNCYYSRFLYAFNFGFAIPQGATILGVSSQVLRLSTGASDVADSLVQLYTGSPVGINHADTTSWTSNPMIITYGDSTDTWGYSLTSDSVNSLQFGLAIMVLNRNISGLIIKASVDHITMTVYYDTGTGVQSQTRNSATFGIHYDASTSTLDIFSPQGKINGVQIIDSKGEEIFHAIPTFANGEKIRLNIPMLSSGIYFVTADINGKKVSRQIIVE